MNVSYGSINQFDREVLFILCSKIVIFLVFLFQKNVCSYPWLSRIILMQKVPCHCGEKNVFCDILMIRRRKVENQSLPEMTGCSAYSNCTFCSSLVAWHLKCWSHYLSWHVLAWQLQGYRIDTGKEILEKYGKFLSASNSSRRITPVPRVPIHTR